MDENLKNRIELFVEHCKAVYTAHCDECGFTIRDSFSIKYAPKWAKIVKGGGVYGFVALVDFSNKQLGQVKTGDIHKAASWTTPAKHARGSVFADDFGNCAGPYGIAYLR